MPMNIRDAINSLEIFRGLSETSSQALARFSQYRSFTAGDTLFRENEPSADVYALLSGEIEFQKNPTGETANSKTLDRVAAGSLFGESAFFEDRPRTATAVTLTEVDVLVIQGVEFRQWVRQEAALGVDFTMGLLESALGR